jgi:hypothetical protein
MSEETTPKADNPFVRGLYFQGSNGLRYRTVIETVAANIQWERNAPYFGGNQEILSHVDAAYAFLMGQALEGLPVFTPKPEKPLIVLKLDTLEEHLE